MEQCYIPKQAREYILEKWVLEEKIWHENIFVLEQI